MIVQSAKFSVETVLYCSLVKGVDVNVGIMIALKIFQRVSSNTTFFLNLLLCKKNPKKRYHLMVSFRGIPCSLAIPEIVERWLSFQWQKVRKKRTKRSVGHPALMYEIQGYDTATSVW